MASGSCVEVEVDRQVNTSGNDYDANGRIFRLDYSQDADVAFAYDGNDQRIEIRDGCGVRTLQHDARAVLVSWQSARVVQRESAL